MTQDDEPMKVDPVLYETMSNMGVHLSMSGHQLGGLCFLLETAEESGAQVLARTDLSPDIRQKTEKLQAITVELLAAVRQGLTYISIAATAQLAEQQDNRQNAPTTPNPQ